MSQQKRRVAVYRHGNAYYIGAMSFFERSPGAALSTIFVLVDGRTASDGDLGRAVRDMLGRSGVLDGSLIARGQPGRTFVTQAFELPSDAVLQSETVTVTVSLQKGELDVSPMRTRGPGKGFTGTDAPDTELDPECPADVLGAAVRQATETAIAESSAVLKPAGSWRGDHAADVATPPAGVVTVRRSAEGWTVTARIGARGGESATASSSVARVARDASFEDLGRAVTQVLGQRDEDLRPGDEDPAGGERQVLVEADEDGLTIYPQAISGDTGVWDVPAHPDLRVLPRQASLADVGQAVSLVADEQTEWG